MWKTADNPHQIPSSKKHLHMSDEHQSKYELLFYKSGFALMWCSFSWEHVLCFDLYQPIIEFKSYGMDVEQKDLACLFPSNQVYFEYNNSVLSCEIPTKSVYNATPPLLTFVQSKTCHQNRWMAFDMILSATVHAILHVKVFKEEPSLTKPNAQCSKTDHYMALTLHCIRLLCLSIRKDKRPSRKFPIVQETEP